jgi:ABC-type uncharacterized transport system ATPase subunit
MADASAVLKGVSHTWPTTGVQVCRNASLHLIPGTVHALVGENGAGKTTLGHILAGVLRPDSGRLLMGFGDFNLAKRNSGILPGVGLVRQRSVWPPNLSAWEAAVLGRSERPRRRIEAVNLFQRTAEQWNLSGVDPHARAADMDAAGRQRAELTAALMFKPSVLILDEPASAWEEGRADEFFSLLETLKKSGHAVLLITHRLRDVFRIADSVTVMRQGFVVGTHEIDSVKLETISEEIFGNWNPYEHQRDTTKTDSGSQRTNQTIEPPRLSLDGVELEDSGRKVLTDITFSLNSGEILGITGLKEEGLGVLEDVVSGNVKPDSGRMMLDGQLVSSDPISMRKKGLRYVPSDKTGRGASLESTLAENLILLESRRLSRRGLLPPSSIHRWTENRRREGDIEGNTGQTLKELSGGNIQKVILQRELTQDARLIVVADPTWGLDEKSRQRIHGQLRSAAEKGAAILLLASDLDEAMELSDRMAVLSGGRLSELLNTPSWEREAAVRLIADNQETV